MLNVFENKTAAAFKVSLLLGATIGGANSEALEILDRFSHNIGIAYQIKDDLSDYHGEKGDIAIRKFSVLLALLAEKLTDAEKKLFHQAVETGNNPVLYKFIDSYEIQKETETLLTNYINQAKSSLENFPNLGLKLALHEILGKIFKEYI